MELVKFEQKLVAFKLAHILSQIRYVTSVITDFTHTLHCLSLEFQEIDVARSADRQARFQSLAIVVQTEDTLRQLDQLSSSLIMQHTNKSNL